MNPSLRTKILLAFAVVYVVWGSTYLAIRIGLESMPPLLMAGARFLLAGVLLTGWCELRKEAKGTREETRNAALAGLFLVTFGNGFVTWAEQSVPSGVTALVVAVGPACTLLLQWIGQDRIRPSIAALGGVALGLTGVGLLVGGSSGGRVDPVGAGLIVLATVSWSYGVLFCQRVPLPASSLRTNAIGMLSGSAAMLVGGFATGEASRFHPQTITLPSLLALGYLVVFGSILAYTCYGWLIRHVSATAAGTTAFVNPAIAVLLGALWGEAIGAKAIVAMAFILGGVWLLKQKREAASSTVQNKPWPSRSRA